MAKETCKENFDKRLEEMKGDLDSLPTTHPMYPTMKAHYDNMKGQVDGMDQLGFLGMMDKMINMK